MFIQANRSVFVHAHGRFLTGHAGVQSAAMTAVVSALCAGIPPGTLCRMVEAASIALRLKGDAGAQLATPPANAAQALLLPQPDETLTGTQPQASADAGAASGWVGAASGASRDQGEEGREEGGSRSAAAEQALKGPLRDAMADNSATNSPTAAGHAADHGPNISGRLSLRIRLRQGKEPASPALSGAHDAAQGASNSPLCLLAKPSQMPSMLH
jgi:hypothetical protein